MEVTYKTRKIRVSGCCNCPYRMYQEEKSYCMHPSFFGDGPEVTPYGLFRDEAVNFPEWCPLDDEFPFYVVSSCAISGRNMDAEV